MIEEKELPDGWKECTLKDIGKIISGGTPSTTESTYWGSDIAWITPADLSGYTAKYISKGRKSISNVGLKNSSARILPKGSVLFSSRAPIGYVAIAGDNLTTNQGFKSIVPNEDIGSDYLYYYLKLNKQLAIDRANGTTFKEISGAKFSELPFIYPLILEQRKIVNKIEELFSELDKGIENLKIAQQQLKVYRQAVLKWAFEGKLTNDLDDGELPKGWELRRLYEVTSKITDGEHFRPITQLSGIPFLSAKDIQDYGVSFKNPLYIAEETADKALKRCNPQKGDILIVSRGATVGRMCIVDTDKTFCLLGSVILIKVNDVIDSKFLTYVLKSPAINQEMIAVSGATAQQAIYLRDVKNIKLPICSRDEQIRVVQEIESRLSVCDKIEETIVDSLQQAEALRQSILKKAFEGKLVKAEVQDEAKVVSINAMRDVWERKVLAGKIIFACHKERSFGTTKFQKLLYLCEQHSQLEFDTHYVKQTAGPLDADFIYPFIREAEKNEWFTQDTNIAPHHFEPLNGLGKLTSDYPKFFKPVSDKINFVIGLLKDKNTDDSELVATIYAIWNNYIIQQQVLEAEILINEVYDWSKSKAKFTKPAILAMWKWMKEVGLVPVGFGKLIKK